MVLSVLIDVNLVVQAIGTEENFKEVERRIAVIISACPDAKMLMSHESIKNAFSEEMTCSEVISFLHNNKIDIISSDSFTMEERVQQLPAHVETVKNLIDNYSMDRHYYLVVQVAYAIIKRVSVIITDNYQHFSLIDRKTNLKIWPFEQLEDKNLKTKQEFQKEIDEIKQQNCDLKKEIDEIKQQNCDLKKQLAKIKKELSDQEQKNKDLTELIKKDGNKSPSNPQGRNIWDLQGGNR
jgi:DNA repair exonuclease SbcCD ATPase subunit